MAIILALKEWRNHLQGAKYPFKIFCDHRNLVFPKNPEDLSDRQIRWFEFLSKFNYEIIYRKGTNKCSTCATMKDKTHKPYGLVQTSETPLKPWTHVHVDFITDLPFSSGFNTVINVVDSFSKMIHLIPTSGLPSAEDVANAFLQNIFRLHGLPLSITSDRGTQFTSRFWKRLLELLNIKIVYSTAHHHASNGQVERLNGIVVQTLRCLCVSDPSLWSYYIPFVEFSINNSVNSTIDKSPFEVVYGYSLNFDPNVSLCQVGGLD